MSEAKPATSEKAVPKRAGDVFIVDNSDSDWKVRDYSPLLTLRASWDV
jgi:hypothetical protein